MAPPIRRLYRIETEVLQQHRYERNGDDKGFAAALWADSHHGDLFPKVARYDAMLRRGLMRALHELERRQARRRGEQVPVPTIVDVDVGMAESEVAPSLDAPSKG